MRSEILQDAIVIEQRVVAIEQEYDLIRRAHAVVSSVRHPKR
jgi:hypothetical protein